VAGVHHTTIVVDHAVISYVSPGGTAVRMLFTDILKRTHLSVIIT